MRIAVFGDSILWGQGLESSNKIATGVKQKLTVAGHGPVELHTFAHSGADVWNDGETPLDLLNPLPHPLVPLGGVPPRAVRDLQDASPAPAERERIGEIPLDTPYSLRELDRASDELTGKTVDLILLDAGINDVNVSHIVLPYMSRHALEARTLSIADRARALLELAHESFPSARIIVTGYYAIVSKFTHVERLVRFAARYVASAPEDWRRHFNVSAHELMLNYTAAVIEQNGGALGTALLLEPLKQRMIELSDIFARSVHRALQEQVVLFNAEHGPKAVLAIPEIPDEHAILTDDPWIWGLDDGLAPEDQVADGRRALAHQLTNDPFKRFVWERASVGHPNLRGARAYVDAVMKAIG